MAPPKLLYFAIIGMISSTKRKSKDTALKSNAFQRMLYSILPEKSLAMGSLSAMRIAFATMRAPTVATAVSVVVIW
jgi:hypothetical protein